MSLPANRKFATSCLGENRWRKASACPGRAKYALYLHSGGRANSRKGDGVLSAVAASNRTSRATFLSMTLKFRSSRPAVPRRRAGSSIRRRSRWATIFSSTRRSRSGEPLRVFGTPRVVLYCSTSSAQYGFHRQARSRASPTARRSSSASASRDQVGFLPSRDTLPDKIHHWEFDLEPTSCFFAAGERIRLEIASSAFPLYDRNPGTEVPSCRATSWDWRRSTQFVYHDGKQPSALYLPVAKSAVMSADASSRKSNSLASASAMATAGMVLRGDGPDSSRRVNSSASSALPVAANPRS